MTTQLTDERLGYLAENRTDIETGEVAAIALELLGRRAMARESVLPMDLDDGTRMRVGAMAGGQDSTDGLPNWMDLHVGWADGLGTTVRYRREDPADTMLGAPPDHQAALARDLAAALNRKSAENGSDTPDFILGDLLVEMLGAFDRAVQRREAWYGRGPQEPCP